MALVDYKSRHCPRNSTFSGLIRTIVFLSLVQFFLCSNRVQAEEERNLWITLGGAVSFVDIVPADESIKPINDTVSLSLDDFDNSQPVIEIAGSYYALVCIGGKPGHGCHYGLGVRAKARHYRLTGRWLDLDSTTDTSSSQTEFYYRNTQVIGEMDLALGMVLSGYSLFSCGIKGSLNDYDLEIFDNQGDLLVEDKSKRSISLSWSIGVNILPYAYFWAGGTPADYPVPLYLHYTYEKSFDGYNKLKVPDINDSEGDRISVDMRQSTHTLSILYNF